MYCTYIHTYIYTYMPRGLWVVGCHTPSVPSACAAGPAAAGLAFFLSLSIRTDK